MKKLLFVTLVASFSSASALAAQINDARFNPQTQKIEVDVTYGGGCEEHIFKLKIGSCMESYPVQCSAKLVETGRPDMCEALIHTTVKIGLKESGLDKEYYNGASLEILGDGDSSASIRLPRN